MEKKLPIVTIYYNEQGGAMMGVRSPVSRMAHYSELGKSGITLCGIECSSWKVKDVEGAQLCNPCRRKANQVTGQ